MADASRSTVINQTGTRRRERGHGRTRYPFGFRQGKVDRSLSTPMVSVISLVLLGVVLVIHTLIAAVMTRFFRIRLKTQWGSVIYALLLIPLVLGVTTLVFFGVLGISGGLTLGTPSLLGLAIGMPLALGFTIDVLYIPSPDEYELPETR
ncbi:hypothetical protein HSB1_30680 [Halogranum salarium B-1]|uniref:DUF7991 domain-containing protein n=2 Tax=Halogranum rubrum TaxID=553466 RepID=J2ZD34_9EURY|nr:hypothetical protein HSB1_30680 [Halogranum salarium B-1]